MSKYNSMFLFIKEKELNEELGSFFIDYILENPSDLPKNFPEKGIELLSKLESCRHNIKTLLKQPKLTILK